MPLALLFTRLLLAAVFAVAGLAKLAAPARTRQTLREFGLPGALAAPLGVLLPLAELALAVALLPLASAWFGAVGALALLLLFSAAVGVNLARGRRPDCNCFGQIASAPIGWPTLARNAVLAALSGLIIVAGRASAGASAVSWLGELTMIERIGLALVLVTLVLVLAETWLLLQLLRQNGRLLVRLDGLEAQVGAGGVPVQAMTESGAPGAGLPVGTPAPAFSLSGLFGETMTLDALRAAGRPLLLAFTDPGCGPCQALAPDLGRWQRELAMSLTLVPISRGTVAENRAKAAEHGLGQVLVQQDREVMTAYQAAGTPSAVLVRPDGSIGSALAQGAEEIRALVARQAGAAPLPLAAYLPANGPTPCPTCGQLHDQPAAAQGLAVGTPAPALKLPDLSGKEVDLADYRGRETVVLFWNTGCGFCQQMLPQLKEWERERPADAPALVVVSAGPPEAIAAQGLLSTVLVDQSFASGLAFAAGGTPSAVKVGRDGTVAGPLAVGGPAVMALLTGQPASAGSAPVPAGAAVPTALQTVHIGDPAPELALPDLDGTTVSLADYRGRPTLLLFWSPSCGFCQQMLPDLRQWEVKRPAGTPEILVVSTGAAQENRLLALRSTVLLDAGMVTGQRFGANGTPMAVLIDADGRVASEVAAGAEAVFALAGR